MRLYASALTQPTARRALASRHRTRRTAVTRGGGGAPPVLQPLFATGHGDRELERAGTPGTPVPGDCPRRSTLFLLVKDYSGTAGTPGTLSAPTSCRAPGARRRPRPV